MDDLHSDSADHNLISPSQSQLLFNQDLKSEDIPLNYLLIIEKALGRAILKQPDLIQLAIVLTDELLTD